MDRACRNILRFVAPFASWILLQTLLPATAWAYAVRTLVTACVGCACWRAFRRDAPQQDTVTRPPLKHLLLGCAAGLIVYALWVLPESSAFYRRWCCWPLGELPAAPTSPSPYDPAVCGWPLTIAKLVGSAFVIAPVEEIFFRSFLYRWLQKGDFLSVDARRFDASAFLWTVFLFTLEHDRPLAAAAAGAAYGLAMMRWGLGAAIAAHVVTNLALAIQVIACGDWAFW